MNNDEQIGSLKGEVKRLHRVVTRRGHRINDLYEENDELRSAIRTLRDELAPLESDYRWIEDRLTALLTSDDEDDHV